MSSEIEHLRTKVDHLRARFERPATEGERIAARNALDVYEAKLASALEAADREVRFVNVEDVLAGVAAGFLFRETPGDRWGSPATSVSQQRARDVFDDLEGIHEAEVHAGKLGTLVVWRIGEEAAARLAHFKNARLRVPDGTIYIARRGWGAVEDPATGRWGILYKRKDLRPAHE